MAQRQWRSDDTDKWKEGFGGGATDITKSADETASLANATCTGTAGTKSLSLGAASSFADGDIIFIHKTQIATTYGAWELNKIVSGGGTTTLTLKYDLMNAYAANSQVVAFIKAKNFTINSGKTVTIPAWNGSIGGIYPVIANGAITITGSIAAQGKGLRNGYFSHVSGEGVTAAPADSGTAANGTTGGGHGTDRDDFYAGGGGGGGNGTSGGTGTNGHGGEQGGYGGASIGNTSLTLINMGGGGGVGGNRTGSGMPSSFYGAAGGPGGGLVILIGKTITVTGSINTSGNNGSGAASDGAGGQGGGGAGGSLLLKGQILDLGTNLCTSAGGSGNVGWGRAGGNGGVGRIHADYSVSITGSTSPAIDSTQDVTIKESGGPKMFLFI